MLQKELIKLMLTFILVCAVCLASATSGGVALARIIGIDFDVGGASGQSPGSTAVAGLVPTAGWNNKVDLNNPAPVCQSV
jgi:hypothetical protein